MARRATAGGERNGGAGENAACADGAAKALLTSFLFPRAEILPGKPRVSRYSGRA